MANGFKAKLATSMPEQLKTAMASMPASKTANLNPQSLTNPNAQEAVKSMFSSFGKQGQVLYEQFIGAVKSSITYGFHNLFILSICFAVAAFIVTFFLKEIPLKKEDYYEDKPAEVE
jgi:hypothetical protein